MNISTSTISMGEIEQQRLKKPKDKPLLQRIEDQKVRDIEYKMYQESLGHFKLFELLIKQEQLRNKMKHSKYYHLLNNMYIRSNLELRREAVVQNENGPECTKAKLYPKQRRAVSVLHQNKAAEN